MSASWAVVYSWHTPTNPTNADQILCFAEFDNKVLQGIVVYVTFSLRDYTLNSFDDFGHFDHREFET